MTQKNNYNLVQSFHVQTDISNILYYVKLNLCRDYDWTVQCTRFAWIYFLFVEKIIWLILPTNINFLCHNIAAWYLGSSRKKTAINNVQSDVTYIVRKTTNTNSFLSVVSRTVLTSVLKQKICIYLFSRCLSHQTRFRNKTFTCRWHI